jgi:hypothetical protein
VHWQWRYHTKLANLRKLYADDCRFRALMGFVRVPYLTESAESGLIAGDLRFDRSPELDFSDMQLGRPSNTECPRFIPPWTPPRSDILAARP